MIIDIVVSRIKQWIQKAMTQIALVTLNHIITLEIMALATISHLKATVYKSWQPLAMKWRLWVDDNCTEHDAIFVFDLPTLPEKVQADPEYNFDHDSLPELVDNFGVDVTVTGYQVAQWLTIFFYGFLQSVLPYCLDLLDRFIQIVYDIRSGIVDNHCDDEIPEYLVRWIPPLTYTDDYL